MKNFNSTYPKYRDSTDVMTDMEMAEGLFQSEIFAIGQRTFKGVWVDTKVMTTQKITKIGHNSRDIDRPFFWRPYT